MNWETFGVIIIPLLIGGGLLYRQIMKSAEKQLASLTGVMEQMADREKARIESDATRTVATVEREKIFNGMVTALQENLNRVEAKYDKLDEDYRKEVQRGNAQEEIIRELHKQVTELPFLRDKVNILQKQIEGIQESRAQRELELKAANDRATTAEARVTALEQERDSLNARIVELEAKVTQLEMVEPRVTHIEAQLGTDEHPAVSPTNGDNLPKAS